MLPATDIATEAVANAVARTESRARAGADQSVDAPSTRAAVPPPAQRPVKASVDTARLAYDQESHRVYVEILDPQTGDVLQRLPPESAAEHLQEINGGQPGALVDDIA